MKRLWPILLVAAAAAAPRLAAIVVLGNDFIKPPRDQFIFAELAQGVADGPGLTLEPDRFYAKARAWHHRALREWVREPEWAFGLVQVGARTSAYEPLYPYTLGATIRLGVPRWLAARLLNLAFAVAAAVAASLVARRLFGDAAAVVTGLAVALYPAYIYYSLLAMSETAHVALLAIFIAAYYASLTRGIAAAVAFGLAAAAFFLTRAIALPLFVLLLFYALLTVKSRRRWVYAATALVTFGLAITPWVYRNYGVHGAFVLTPTRGGVNLWMRNNPTVLALEAGGANGKDWRESLPALRRADLLSYPDFGDADELSRDRLLRRRMLSFLRANPAYFARTCGRRFLELIRPYGPTVAGSFQKAAATAPYVLALIFGVVGFVAAARRREFRHVAPLVLIFVFYLLYYTVLHGGVRYRLPADVCLLIGAGRGLVALTAYIRRGKGPRKV